MDMGARGEPQWPPPPPQFTSCFRGSAACQRRASCRGTLGGALAFKNKGLLLQTCLPQIQTFRSDLSIASDSRLHLETDALEHERAEDGAGQSDGLIEASFAKVCWRRVSVWSVSVSAVVVTSCWACLCVFVTGCRGL